MFSSKSDEWATPFWLFDELDGEFDFNLDPCCTKENKKCSKYFTIEQDGLSQNWGGVEYFVIHLIHKLESGLKRLFMKRRKKTLWLFC